MLASWAGNTLSWDWNSWLSIALASPFISVIATLIGPVEECTTSTQHFNTQPSIISILNATPEFVWICMRPYKMFVDIVADDTTISRLTRLHWCWSNSNARWTPIWSCNWIGSVTISLTCPRFTGLNVWKSQR